LGGSELTSKSVTTFRGTSATSASLACVKKAMPLAARHCAGVISSTGRGYGASCCLAATGRWSAAVADCGQSSYVDGCRSVVHPSQAPCFVTLLYHVIVSSRPSQAMSWLATIASRRSP
jgi:hypothetical protein